MQLKSVDPVDISKTASAASIIFNALKKAIIEGDLEEGAPLRQDEIARMFSTSRIPVREAISRLEEHGLVKSQRYKGAVVSGLSAEEADEIFDYRSLLEPHVIRAAVPNMTPAILTEARAYLEAFAKSEDPMEWGNLNRQFHATLYNASGLSFHLEAIESALDRIDRYLRAQLVLSDGMIRANDEHIRILAACERGDADTAAELTRQHILGSKDSLLKNLSKL
ncbi:HTH-type transcriptional repressor RspR [Aliiroseovarius sp. xm-m-379]|uniref:GntR family transcriptional regulator n=1 Tax=unclassified Aliiroseovarius TaxID=2623558 RepID=UPI001568919C|nr:MULTISPECIES: GntR family transcriptional regulator [unclassified Aliiroseovarius]NRP13597.1 HTH-type transcriptional repressor RspR [Aliiroseovarius sp. xm-d-517]NRP25031.1 HTH-type transcriptional repressor RspR [Aliiroseovarius sp. xm-m-379]NRP31448.1 HTH-type transcriptional repressor RspR [Aliiroseovarius sp. xm-m-314]NRP33830.1 HTH-type transcriptional repressor RspR [Aliiroseovarius sp. xm-a-104]NRP41263.1 HTH-type transcriptional repressor RspR [Aliiroseovarius sp. xm-m-339-2]